MGAALTAQLNMVEMTVLATWRPRAEVAVHDLSQQLVDPIRIHATMDAYEKECMF